MNDEQHSHLRAQHDHSFVPEMADKPEQNVGPSHAAGEDAATLNQPHEAESQHQHDQPEVDAMNRGQIPDQSEAETMNTEAEAYATPDNQARERYVHAQPGRKVPRSRTRRHKVRPSRTPLPLHLAFYERAWARGDRSHRDGQRHKRNGFWDFLPTLLGRGRRARTRESADTAEMRAMLQSLVNQLDHRPRAQSQDQSGVQEQLERLSGLVQDLERSVTELKTSGLHAGPARVQFSQRRRQRAEEYDAVLKEIFETNLELRKGMTERKKESNAADAEASQTVSATPSDAEKEA